MRSRSRPPLYPVVAAGAGLSAAALAAWAGWIEPRRLVVREFELELPHWPARLSGLRAGILSDLRKHRHYEKPSEKRKRKLNAAQRKNKRSRAH